MAKFVRSLRKGHGSVSYMDNGRIDIYHRGKGCGWVRKDGKVYRGFGAQGWAVQSAKLYEAVNSAIIQGYGTHGSMFADDGIGWAEWKKGKTA